jgi:enoyl-CoA hydratase/carnithine racemase
METSRITEWQVIDGTIGVLTINNMPQNFLLEPEFVELEQLKKWITESAVKGLIVTGAGRHFSAGADVPSIFQMAKKSSKEMENRLNSGKSVLTYIENLNIPVVAAIQGCCFGGGLEIALSCHIRVASAGSIFAFPETFMKLMPGLGGNARLMKKCGFSKAVNMILTAETIDDQAAYDINLIDYLVPKKQAMEFSTQLIQKMIKDKPLEVINSVMSLLNQSKHAPMQELMEEETRLFCKLAFNVIKSIDNAM